MKRTNSLLPLLLAAMLLPAALTGCGQAADAAPASAETVDVSAVFSMAGEAAADPVAVPTFPARYEKRLSFDGLDVWIDAEVVVPPLAAYPTYILEPLRFTQEQADRIMAALLGDMELYDETNAYNRKYIQGLIDSYEAEIAACKGDPAFEELIPTFEGYIARLREEYEAAPEDSTYTPASRILMPKNTQVASMTYGTEQVGEDGGIRYEWSETAVRRAAADGYGAITGVCWKPGGPKKWFRIENAWSGSVYYGLPDGEPGASAGADFTQAEAEARGAALLQAMGLDCELVFVQRYAPDGAPPFYQLRYCTAVPGTAGADITPLRCVSETDMHEDAVNAEGILLALDNEGVYYFQWYNPIRAKAIEQPSASLCAWADIAEVIDTMLGVKQFWSTYAEAPNDPTIVGRRIEIDRIQLSYMQVMRGPDLAERAYLPVWDVCGRLVYRYDAQYAERDGGWTLDENRERTVTAQNMVKTYSLLTINALDGTVLDRWG